MGSSSFDLPQYNSNDSPPKSNEQQFDSLIPREEVSKSSLSIDSNATLQQGTVTTATAGKFMLCFVGLQVSYLTWGYMQEAIMTTRFIPTAASPNGTFTDKDTMRRKRF